MVETRNPEAWRIFRKDFDLVKDNQAVLEACWEAAAAKTKKEQRCSVVVPIQ